MEDIREQIDIASEISLAVSQPIGLSLDANEVCYNFYEKPGRIGK